MANLIQLHRKRLGIKQADLAQQLNIKPQTLSKLESGLQRLTPYWTERIAAALNVAPEDLLADSLQHKIGAQPSVGHIVEGDMVKTDLERLVLRFWRSLPQQGQDEIVARLTQWALRRRPGDGGTARSA